MRIYRKKIERITIIGKRGDPDKLDGGHDKSFDYCLKNGYDIKWTGSPRKTKYVMDITRYKIIAEREL